MSWVTLAALIWLLGAGCHWWPGPLAVTTSLYRHATNRWSDPDDTTEDDPDDMSRHDNPEGADEGDDRVRYIRRPSGPRPLDELLDEGDEDDDEDDERDPWTPRRGEHRQDWVARQAERRGARTTDIQRRGARYYGCTERTIQRDLRALAEDHDPGTMRRDQ